MAKKEGVTDVGKGKGQQDKGRDSGSVGTTPEDAARETRRSLRALFEQYEEKEAMVKEAQQELDMAKGEAYKVVAQIHEIGGTGPYKWAGDQLTIVKRGTTYFFRGKKKEMTGIDVDGEE